MSDSEGAGGSGEPPMPDSAEPAGPQASETGPTEMQEPAQGPRLSRKWKVTITLVLIAAVAAAIGIAIRQVKPMTRVEFYDNGKGEPDAEIRSVGAVQIKFDMSFRPQMAPLPEQKSADVLVMDDLELFGERYRVGDRLFSSEGRFAHQTWIQARLNDLRYHAWRLKQPAEPRPFPAFVRVREVQLRSAPKTSLAKGVVLPFSTPVSVVSTQGDWLKVTAPTPKARGWLHRAVTIRDRRRVEQLQKTGAIPGLLLLIEAKNPKQIESTTLAGSMFFRVGSGEPELELRSNDCLLIEEAALPHLPKPLKFTSYTVQAPLATKIYCAVGAATELEPRDWLEQNR